MKTFWLGYEDNCAHLRYSYIEILRIRKEAVPYSSVKSSFELVGL